MMVPPQNGLVLPRETRAICQGISLGLASVPPTMAPVASATPHACPVGGCVVDVVVVVVVVVVVGVVGAAVVGAAVVGAAVVGAAVVGAGVVDPSSSSNGRQKVELSDPSIT